MNSIEMSSINCIIKVDVESNNKEVDSNLHQQNLSRLSGMEMISAFEQGNLIDEEDKISTQRLRLKENPKILENNLESASKEIFKNSYDDLNFKRNSPFIINNRGKVFGTTNYNEDNFFRNDDQQIKRDINKEKISEKQKNLKQINDSIISIFHSPSKFPFEIDNKILLSLTLNYLNIDKDKIDDALIYGEAANI